MSSQQYRNQEYEDQIAYLMRKINEIEAILNQSYEDNYDQEDIS